MSFVQPTDDDTTADESEHATVREQSSLTDDWQPTHDDEDPEDATRRVQYDIDAGACQYCGASVTTQFVRVFGDNQGLAHACLECVTFRELQDGAAATEDYTPDSESGEVNW